MSDTLPPENPLVALRLRFRDGCGLEWTFEPEVPQAKAMAALGHFAADVGQKPELTGILPSLAVERLSEAIEAFLAKQETEDWSSGEMAAAILSEL
ncbi:hypothetical protein LCGC14_1049010 [marine sediment metagenome]|uniref:Uncharacterized protein n=1 Tax=marine sediment metagenome TaxID=412755 RepID=A0A0F9Q7H9_9ZZZZ